MKKYVITIGDKPFTVNGTEKSGNFKQIFTERILSLFQIKEFIENGYFFSPNLKNPSYGKKKGNIKSFSYIPLDCDGCEVNWDEFCDTIFNKLNSKFKPSFIYQTLRHSIKGNRYRLFFMLNHEINYEMYLKIYEILETEIKKIINIEFDDKMKDENQGTLGTDTSLGRKVISPYNIIDVESILTGLSINVNIGSIVQRVQNNNHYYYNNNLDINSNGMTKCTPPPKEEIDNFTKEERIKFFNGDFREYIKNGKTKYNIIENNFHLFNSPIIFHKDVIEIIYPYYFTDENGKIKTHYKKIKDGQRRQRSLFWNAVKIRLIKPSISKEELLWNMCYWMDEHIDNTQDPITRYELLKLCNEILNKDIEELKEKYSKIKEKELEHIFSSGKRKLPYRSNPYWCKEHGVSGRSVILQYQKEKNNKTNNSDNKKEKVKDRIIRMYNKDLSMNENCEIIGCSINTLKKCKQRYKENFL